MADRPLNRDATLLVDIAGADSSTVVTVDVTNPLGTASVPIGTLATWVGKDRFRFTIPAVLMTQPGFWLANWQTSTTQTLQLFSVGTQPANGMSRYQIRQQIELRASQFSTPSLVVGKTTYCAGTNVVDVGLIGGADEYVFWHLMPPPTHPDSGRGFRVINYNGDALIIDEPMTRDLFVGESFSLFRYDPAEIDLAINQAIAELTQTGRIIVELPSLPVSNNIVTLPLYLTHVVALYDTTTLLKPTTWSLQPGRTIYFNAAPGASTIKVVGLRDAGYPNWDDSIIEVDPTAVIARATMLVHSSRVSGAALDQDEHLRRMLTWEQDFERIKRIAVRRVPATAREVL